MYSSAIIWVDQPKRQRVRQLLVAVLKLGAGLPLRSMGVRVKGIEGRDVGAVRVECDDGGCGKQLLQRGGRQEHLVAGQLRASSVVGEGVLRRPGELCWLGVGGHCGAL